MPYNLKQHFRKTKLCPMQLEGHCGSGDHCDYAHSVDELRVIPDLRRTKLCPKSIKGYQCSDENCTFAHNPTELRACANLWAFKTSLCSFHLRSRCLNGPQCRFAHDPSELRPHPTEMSKESVPSAEGPLLKDIMPALLLPSRGAPLNLEYRLPNTPLSAFAEIAGSILHSVTDKDSTTDSSGRLTEASPPETRTAGAPLPEELRFSPLVIRHLSPDEPLPPALRPSEGNTLAQFPPPMFDRRASVTASPVGSDSTIASIWSDQSGSPDSTAMSTTCQVPMTETREGGGKKHAYSRQFLLEVFAAMNLGRAAAANKTSAETQKPLNADAPEFVPKTLCQPSYLAPSTDSPLVMFSHYPSAPVYSPPLISSPLVAPICRHPSSLQAFTAGNTARGRQEDQLSAVANVAGCAMFAPRNNPPAPRSSRMVRLRNEFGMRQGKQTSMRQLNGAGGYAALRPVIM
eukprot:GHVS01048757.1.p1 GENE.GHVS01048757.1~~GHVS01048757.1.p1  ORF type:complete len:460 (+),score=63.32 GHVS01048757.1:196-1575(+)